MHLNIRTGVKHGALRISKHPLRDHHLLAILKTKGKKNSSLFRSTSFSLSSVLLSIFFLFSLHVFFYQTDQSLLPPPPNPSMKSLWRFMNFQIHFHWEISFSCFHACPKTLLSVGYFIFLPFSLFDFGVRVSNFVSVLIESLEAIYEF